VVGGNETRLSQVIGIFIQVHCPACHEVEAVISGWEDTLWAEGQMEPVPMTDD